MKKIILYDRNLGKEVNFIDKYSTMKALFSPVSSAYNYYSPTINNLIQKYGNNPLVPHKITPYEQTRLKYDSDFINDIPRFDVVGYDKIISHEHFERKLRDEFYYLYSIADKRIVECINKHHKNYKAIVKE